MCIQTSSKRKCTFATHSHISPWPVVGPFFRRVETEFLEPGYLKWEGYRSNKVISLCNLLVQLFNQVASTYYFVQKM